QCRKACREQIASCVGAGGRPRACRRRVLGRCKREGVAACRGEAFAPSTTTTTLPGGGSPAAGGAIRTVFLIVMENTDWADIEGSSSAPYINNTLLPLASRAEQYYNPPNMHPRYNVIVPDLCHDMHQNISCSQSNRVRFGDTWLSTEVPKILASPAYLDNGALFVTWDEAASNDGPIGMIVLSPKAKRGYSNSIAYDHGSTLRTLQEIFGV